MYKKMLVVGLVLLNGCTTLSSDDDFSNAIGSVSQKANYITVEAKGVTPIESDSKGGFAIKNVSKVIASFPTNESSTAPDSYVAVELSYFKSNNEYTSVSIKNKQRAITMTAPTDETCSEHCTVTQHFSFPIYENELLSAAENGLHYSVNARNNSSQLNFLIPAGYFEAILGEQKQNVTIVKNENNVPKQPAVMASKPVEMAQYWYNEANVEDKQRFAQWAFENRKSISTQLPATSKSLDMLSYWYEKATTEEKTQILTWLLNN
ncbi:hypothetical protein ACHE4L_003997 [Vibrio vulnificus]